MRRREFIAGLGSLAALPLGARAQQPARMRRIGVLMATNENDSEPEVELSGFRQWLAELGWVDGRNLQIDVRWGAGNVGRMHQLAKELVGLQPDVILAHTTPVTAALQKETQTIPIIFCNVADPVGAGFVATLSRPGGNLTGFLLMEAGMVGKWLQLLTEIAPAVERAAIMFNPDTAPGGGTYFLPSFEAAARSRTVEPIAAPVHTDAEIEAAITSLGREPRGGLVVMPDAFMTAHRAPVISVAARNNVPVVYYQTTFTRDGGLLSYGPDNRDVFRRAAPYVDRILRGAKPADLPIQLPVKFEMTLNLKTARALGLEVPETLLAIADEVMR
jgi:putative tryptophan/tyrosine transport system substrate-binding protein